jgi:hypothetical protein
MPMMGPPRQVLAIFSAWRKDMASHHGSAAPENSLRLNALIAVKPPEGKFSTSPQLLKLWNKTAAAVKIERCVRLGSEQHVGFIKQSGLPPFLAHLLHPAT